MSKSHIYQGVEYLELDEYPGYAISASAEVLNLRTLKLQKTHVKTRVTKGQVKPAHHLVAMTISGKRCCVRLARMFALAFIPPPKELENKRLEVSYLDPNNLFPTKETVEWVLVSARNNTRMCEVLDSETKSRKVYASIKEMCRDQGISHRQLYPLLRGHENECRFSRGVRSIIVHPRDKKIPLK